MGCSNAYDQQAFPVPGFEPTLNSRRKAKRILNKLAKTDEYVRGCPNNFAQVF